MPLSEAGNYGEFRIYEGDHITLWAEMEERGEVPRDSDYEEHPRGRVNYNTRTKQFTLFVDRCILRKKNVMKKLMSLMRLTPYHVLTRLSESGVRQWVETGWRSTGQVGYAHLHFRIHSIAAEVRCGV